MKKIILIIATAVLSSAMVHAQDIITQKDGQEIKAKVLEVNPNEVKYKLYDELDGATYTVKKSELLLIKYESGRNEVFTKNSDSGLYYTNREPVENLSVGMKYKELKHIYNYKEFSPALADRYSPAWSGVASFFIPGLGQMICNEFGRGFLILGGSLAGSVLGTAFLETTTLNYSGLSTLDGVSEVQANTSGNNIIALAAFAGVLALDIFAIIDGVHVAKVKNMYEQDLKKAYALEMSVSPSFDYAMIGNSYQPTAGLTLAVRF